jgi:hypothetical protein
VIVVGASGSNPNRVHQSVEKMPEHSVTNRRVGAFLHSAFAEALGFCPVFVGPLLENLKTDTTFLLRSASGEIAGTENRF